MKARYFLLGLMCASIVVGCSNTTNTAADSETANVSAEKVESNKETVAKEIEVDAYVTIPKSQQIYVDFPVTITDIKVKEGQKVNKGDVLFVFDDSEYKAEIEKQKNTIEEIQVEIERLESVTNPSVLEIAELEDELGLKQSYKANGTNPDIKMLENELAVQKVDLKALEDKLAMQKNILEVGGTSQEEINALEDQISSKNEGISKIKTNIHKLEESESLEISNLQKQIEGKRMQVSQDDSTTAYGIKAQKVKLKTAQLELKLMEEKLKQLGIKDNTIIAVNDNSIIYDIDCLKEQKVTSENTLAKCMKVEDLVVTAEVPSEDIADVKEGDNVILDVYSEKNANINGKVKRISNNAKEKDGDTIVEVEVEVLEGKDLLKVGSKLDATVQIMK
ncbi:HlyD family secretion protein [Cellulosilyticum ruminicola]|uniref:HlyD family secretion protein n=1 Tax=Cellulosilyticum ruminicola TaxID=425254 RepID=UPI0006D286D0|nr:HlyD family efflux transporter periplasmic adaptor subunit [Cellulosilyticum ruminicola]